MRPLSSSHLSLAAMNNRRRSSMSGSIGLLPQGHAELPLPGVNMKMFRRSLRQDDCIKLIQLMFAE